jgi:hypothetical protein
MVDGISYLMNEIGLSAYSPNKAEDVEEYLLALNPSLRGRIKQLLGWKFFACAGSPDERPKNCYETAAFVKGLDYLGGRVAVETSGPILSQQAQVHSMLAAGGYRKAAEFFPFHIVIDSVRQSAVVAGANPALIAKTLKRGDLLLFGGQGVNPQGENFDRYLHAVVYLGQYRGQHYVFEKQGWACGPESPYRIVPLEAIIEEQVGLPATYKDVCLDRIFVLRKF